MDHDLVLRYLPLIRGVLAHIRHPRSLHDDLLQEGAIGLMNAARDWRPDGGASFHHYARLRIRGAILDAMRSFGTTVRFSRHVAKKARTQGQALLCRPLSLDDHRSNEVLVDTLDPCRTTDLRDEVAALLATLAPRTRDAVLLTHGLRGLQPHSLREAGKLLHISESRVSQLLAAAYTSCRRP